MRRAPWVLRSSRAASSRAQSLLPSRGKASDRARLVSVRSVRVFPRFLRLVATFRPEIQLKVVGCPRECTRDPHGDTRDTHGGNLFDTYQRNRGATVVFTSVFAKCHGDLGTPARVSFERSSCYWKCLSRGKYRSSGCPFYFSYFIFIFVVSMLEIVSNVTLS